MKDLLKSIIKPFTTRKSWLQFEFGAVILLSNHIESDSLAQFFSTYLYSEPVYTIISGYKQFYMRKILPEEVPSHIFVIFSYGTM